ncbi:MFS transporter [Haloglycomyces albus]|uniref:MFS transporter n=1 Tax=Haloglycomyces albus TaxID=526067 RepID=UPI002481194A|nr:MFS transporter [Haloglycomyces albus]
MAHVDSVPGLLRDRAFRHFIASIGCGAFAQRIMMFAVPMISVYVLHSTELQIGITTALNTLAVLLFGLPVGVWVDRLSLKPLLIVTGLARAIAMAAIPVMWLTGWLSFLSLAIVVFLVGTLNLLYETARHSLLPVLVGRRRLGAGNATAAGVHQSLTLSAPSLGGGIVAAIGAPFTLLVSAVGSAVSSLFLTRVSVRRETHHHSDDPHAIREVSEGLHYVRHHRILRPLLYSDMWLNLCAAMYTAVHIVYMARTLHASPTVIGFVLAVAAAGGITGALVTRHLTRAIGQGRTLVASLALLAPFILLLPMIHNDRLVWTVGIGGAGVGFCTIVYNITQMTVRQTLTPDFILGRVNATFRVATALTASTGAVVGGAVAAEWGQRSALWATGLLALVACLPVAKSAIVRCRDFRVYTRLRPWTPARPTRRDY